MLRVLEALHLRVGDEDDRHVPLGADLVQERDDLPPVREGVCVALAVAAVGLLDALHAVVRADAVPHEALRPVERVEAQRLVVVFLVAYRLELREKLLERPDERKPRAVDLGETVFGLDEHGLRGVRREGRLAHALRSVDHEARRNGLSALDDILQQCHCLFPLGLFVCV